MHCTTHFRCTPEAAHRVSRLSGIFLIMVFLAGCASAHIQDPVFTKTGAAAPTEILVQAQSPAGADANTDLQYSASVLQAKTILRLNKARVPAAAYHSGDTQPGAVILRIRVTKADPGVNWKRQLIGFGAGKAKLQVSVQLQSTDETRQPMSSFDTRGDSGRMPGFVAMPGGVALATQTIVPLIVGGGIRLTTASNDGLEHPLDKTADAITAELKKYYVSVGWAWSSQNGTAKNGPEESGK